ncbi:MAG: hypothetical protein PHE43_02625 [Candidatus Nanoarchaeia archaeon]|nr:hypothetical protein [Candidatus Nanoarchaeia archaeon]
MYLLRKIKSFREKFRKTKPLINKTEHKYLQLLKSIGNKKRVKKLSREFLILLNKFKKTEMYIYMEGDVERLRKNAIEIMKNPKQNKLKWLFVVFMLTVPGTFNFIPIVMFFRYLRFRRKNKKKK